MPSKRLLEDERKDLTEEEEIMSQIGALLKRKGEILATMSREVVNYSNQAYSGGGGVGPYGDRYSNLEDELAKVTAELRALAKKLESVAEKDSIFLSLLKKELKK